VTDAKTSAAGPDARLRWLALGVIALAQMLVVVDHTIVTIALPSVQRAIGLSSSDRQWVVTAYALAFGGLLMLGGRLGDMFGRRRVLLVGVIGFTCASAVGGASTDTAMLIAARSFQGVFAAVLAPSALALLAVTFTDPKERGKAFGVFTAVMMTGAATGLILGGVLTEFASWRWCFYVNVPLAVVILVGIFTVLPQDPPRPADGARPSVGGLDVPGVVLGCGGIGALEIGLAFSPDRGWGSAPVVGSLIAAAVLLALFGAWQTRAPRPILPARVLADRVRGGAFFAMVVNPFAMVGMFLFMTYQFQVVMHYSPTRAGLAFLPYVVCVVFSSTQITARLATRVPPRALVIPGLALVACGLLLLSTLTPDSSYTTHALPALVLFGLGTGASMPTCMSLATRTPDPRDAGIASAFANTTQQLGGSLGAAVLNTISVTAAASFLTSHHTADAAARAVSHGNATAAASAMIPIVLTAALLAVVLRPRPTPAKPTLESAAASPAPSEAV
jgi:EmrB/QacA subfamily drug resistance transporter